MSEWFIKGEAPSGKIKELRQRFTSEQAAEDYAKGLTLWRRTWVVLAGTAPRNRRGSDPNAVAGAFAEIEAAVIKGERCPMNGAGNVNSASLGVLARAGRIRIEVSAKNWRVVSILKGPHAGKSTAPPPGPSKPPYVIIGEGGRAHRIKSSI
jgi:hypothetical protein